MKFFNRSGLGWGFIEHRWERRTNYAILGGLVITILSYYIQLDATEQIAIFFFVLIGLFHLIARVSHIVEKRKMKDVRPWVKK